MKQLKNNKEFIISFVSCIVLVLVLCYLGINNYVSDTYAAYTCDGLILVNEKYCCPSSRPVYSGGYCISSDLSSKGYCTKTVTSSETDSNVAKQACGSGWKATKLTQNGILSNSGWSVNCESTTISSCYESYGTSAKNASKIDESAGGYDTQTACSSGLPSQKCCVPKNNKWYRDPCSIFNGESECASKIGINGGGSCCVQTSDGRWMISNNCGNSPSDDDATKIVTVTFGSIEKTCNDIKSDQSCQVVVPDGIWGLVGSNCTKLWRGGETRYTQFNLSFESCSDTPEDPANPNPGNPGGDTPKDPSNPNPNPGNPGGDDNDGGDAPNGGIGGGTEDGGTSDSNGGNGGVQNNPQTGEIAIFVCWLVGITAIGYAIWYFKEIKEN